MCRCMLYWKQVICISTVSLFYKGTASAPSSFVSSCPLSRVPCTQGRFATIWKKIPLVDPTTYHTSTTLMEVRGDKTYGTWILLMALSCKPLIGEMLNSLDAGLKRHQPVEANLFCPVFVFLDLTRHPHDWEIFSDDFFSGTHEEPDGCNMLFTPDSTSKTEMIIKTKILYIEYPGFLTMGLKRSRHKVQIDIGWVQFKISGRMQHHWW